MPQSGSAQPQSSWLDDVAADIRWDRDDDLRRDGARRTREGRAPAGSRLDRVRRVDDWMAEEPAGDSNWSHQPAPATSPDRFAEPRRQTESPEPRRQTESPEPRRQTAPRAPADDRAQGQSRTQAESSAVAESLPERRTITITGRGADRGWTPNRLAGGRGTTPDASRTVLRCGPSCSAWRSRSAPRPARTPRCCRTRF